GSTARTVFIPSVTAGMAGCQAIPGASYSAIPIVPPPTSIQAAQHPDLNLNLRGWQPTNATLGMVYYNAGNGGPDRNAPQLANLFDDDRVPRFSQVDRVYNWDWSTNRRGSLDTDWPVTLAGMTVMPGEVISLPSSGYRIYQNVYQAMVLYASQQEI